MGFADEDDPITPPSTVSPARRLTSVDLKDLDGIEYRANSKIEDRQLFLVRPEARGILASQGWPWWRLLLPLGVKRLVATSSFVLGTGRSREK